MHSSTANKRTSLSRFSAGLLYFLFLFFASFLQAEAASVTLHWDPNSEPGLAGYVLYYKTETAGAPYDGTGLDQGDSGVRVPLSELADPTSPQIAMSGLASGQKYFFAVTAYDAGGLESRYSNEVSFETSTQTSGYTVDATSGPNGTITPSGSIQVLPGENLTFQIAPDEHYLIDDVVVDGVSVGPVETYTLSDIQSDHTVSASFALKSYTISATAGENGVVSPSGEVSVAAGADQSFSISPDAGYRIDDVTVDGASVGAVESYTFSSVAESHTIAASFAADAVTITATAGTGGQISPSGSVQVPMGGSQEFVMAPDAGYDIGDVTVDGASIGAVSSYTFSDVTTDHGIAVEFTPTPMAPIVDAGPDQLVQPQALVQLSGANSIDLDDGIVSLQWQQSGGVPVTLSCESEMECTFVAPSVGSSGESLLFSLQGTDASGLTRTDTAIVNVSWSNLPPAAEAGEDRTVVPGETVVIDGSMSFDPEAGGLTHSWAQVEGSAVALSDPYAEQPSFIAPDVFPGGETLRFELSVTDNGGLISRDTCLVRVTSDNAPPSVGAGDDQTVPGGASVRLDGTGSYDADGGIALFLWKQLSGPPVVFSDSTAVMPQFAAPPVSPGAEGETLVFLLTGVDDRGLKAADTCAVSVTDGGEPADLDFEALGAFHGQDITLAAPGYGALDWTLPETPANPNDEGHWTIVADGTSFAAKSGQVWIQGNAADIRGPERKFVADFAKFARLNGRNLAFESMALRTSFADNPGKDKNGDGIDDRWLSQVEIRFKDIDGKEIRHTVYFSEDAWTVLTAADVPGLSTLSLLESISFYGDAEKSSVAGDSFGLDDLTLRLY